MSNALKTEKKTETELIVSNHMVLFGGKDLDHEHFTKNTDFESTYTATGRLYVDWEHGLDSDKDAPGSNDVLGYVDWSTAKIDEKGLWVQRVLNRRNQYMQYIEPLIDAGLIGNSSEALPNQVQKTVDGEIVRWGLKRDTLTVNPAEPRMMTENVITALKSLAETFPNLKALVQDAESVAPNATAPDAEAKTKQPAAARQGANTMTDTVTLSQEQFDQLLAKGKTLDGSGVIAQPPAPAPEIVEDPAMKAIQDQMDEILELIAANAPAKDAGYISPDSDGNEDPSKTFGDFLYSIRTGKSDRLKSVYGSKRTKTALAEGAGTTGGYLVPTEFSNAIIAKVGDFSVLRRAGGQVVPMARRTREIPALDIETAPSAGDTAFAGGVIAYYTAEAGLITESEPKFRLIELVAHKLAALSLASNEVRDDATESIDGLLATCFARAFASKENYNFFRGDGVGKPFGILNSSALISASRSAASAVALSDVAEMVSRQMPESINAGTLAWFINPTVIEKLIQLVSNPLSWMENLRQGMPVTLLGYPVYITGALPAINTAGDILLVDPSYYLIGDRKQVEIAISEHYKFANDQLAWRAIMRHDGQPWIDSSVTLENASTTVSPFVALAAG